MIELTTKLTACPICGSKKLRDSNQLGRLMVSKCLSCDQWFVNPRMSDSDTRKYYMGEYRNTVNGAVADQRDAARQRERARFQFLTCGKYINACRTAVEIGCSMGYLMDQLNMYLEIECWGVEPDERYHHLEPARNFPLVTFAEYLPDRRFDLIAMSHSLEHLNNPVKELESLRDLHAYEKTKFLIEVPNLTPLPGTLNDHHPFAYTEKTLNQLMAKIGYKPEFFIKHGLNVPGRDYYLLGVYIHG